MVLVLMVAPYLVLLKDSTLYNGTAVKLYKQPHSTCSPFQTVMKDAVFRLIQSLGQLFPV